MTDYRRFFPGGVGLTDPRPDSASGNRGFTLIELIMVVALIGILATLAIPAFNNYTDKTKTARAASEIRTMSTEITGYSLDKGSYPDTLALINRPNYKDPWKRDYVYYNWTVATPQLPTAPLPQVPLKDTIGTTQLNTDYDLYSLGPDGVTAEVGGVAATVNDIARSNDGAFVGLRD